MQTQSLIRQVITMALMVYAICPWSAIADTRTYQATTDFPVIDAGLAPYYSEAPGRPSLAINAANAAYRDVFARAEVVYDGSPAIHDFVLVALAELDGEAEYRLLINGVVVGTATNPEVSLDYTAVRHTFPAISVPAGAVLAVESLANTNGKIPEGNGTAYARGRWTALELVESTDEPVGELTSPEPTPANIDLALSMSNSPQPVLVNELFDIELVLSNAENSMTATQPTVNLVLPQTPLTIVSAESCLADLPELICSFPELPAGASHIMSVSLTATQAGRNLAINASANADQEDRDGTNNTATLTIAVESPVPGADSESPVVSTGNVTTGISTASGAVSVIWNVCLVLLLAMRRRTTLVD